MKQCNFNYCSRVFWFVIVLLFMVQCSNQAKRKYYKHSADKCVNTINIGVEKSAKITRPTDWGSNCYWHFVGTTTCKPVLECDQISLQKRETCEDEYLRLSDGIGGEIIHCNNNTETKIGPFVTQSGVVRDIFLEYASSDFNKPLQRTKRSLNEGTRRSKREVGSQFTCNVRCLKPGESASRIPPSYAPFKSTCVCGMTNHNVDGQKRIQPVLDDYPWVAAIVKTGSRTPLCGTSIINDRFFLTAASCIVSSAANLTVKDVEVLIKAYELDSSTTDSDESSQRISIAEVITHPLSNSKHDYDVALLRAKRKLDLTAPLAPVPVCLPSLFTETYDGFFGVVADWNLPNPSSKEGQAKTLESMAFPVWDLDDCRATTNDILTKRVLCGGFEEEDSDNCIRKAGAALAIEKPESKQFEQIGIATWMNGCRDKKRLALFTRVTEVQQWIRFIGNKYGANWCETQKP